MAHGSTGQIGAKRQRNLFERTVETLATGLGDSITWLVDHGVLFGVFALLWVAFAIAAIASPASLDQAWDAIGGWPLIVQAVAWLLFLPVMVGLWVWETSWPLVLRLVFVVGIAAWNLLVFRPRRTEAPRSV